MKKLTSEYVVCSPGKLDTGASHMQDIRYTAMYCSISAL